MKNLDGVTLFLSFLLEEYRMLRSFPRLVLPDDVLSLEGERFSVLVQRTCGDVIKELMHILALNSTRQLLMVDSDILALIQQNYRELEKIKHQQQH